MDIFSKDKTIISDVINRLLNCRELKELYVFGECEAELEYLYPAIHVIRGNIREDVTGDAVYIHISNRDELEQMIPWIVEEKGAKDFIIYISSDIEISNEERKVLGEPNALNQYSAL